MIKNIKLVLIISVLLFLMPCAVAQISLTNDPIKDTIEHNETALFEFTLTNEQAFSDNIRVRPANLRYGNIIFPDGSQFDLEPGDSETFSVRITPPRTVKIGSYALEFLAMSSTNSSIRTSDFVNFNIISELPELKVTFSIPERTKPESAPIVILVENVGTETIEDLSGRLYFLDEEYDVKIGTLLHEETKVIFNEEIPIPATYESGMQKIELVVYQNDQEFQVYSKLLDIEPDEKITITKLPKEGVITKGETIIIRNRGNTVIKDVFSTELTKFDDKFSTFNPSPDSVADLGEEISYIWSYELEPGEILEINYSIDYSPILVIVLFLIMLSFFSYMKFVKSDFTITKEAKLSDKNTKLLKVKIHVKNNMSEEKKDILIKDQVPPYLKLTEEFGTLEPSIVKKAKEKTVMTWKLNKIIPGEERILSYELKPKMKVIGKIELGSAKLKYKENNRIKQFTSNKITLKGKVSVSEE